MLPSWPSLSSKRDVNFNETWLNKGKNRIKKTATIPSFSSPPQDSKGLPDVSWPPSDLAAEHGREAQQQEVLHWVGYVSGPRCCPGGRISQHAGRSQVPACWQRHLPGTKPRYTHQINEEIIIKTCLHWKKEQLQPHKISIQNLFVVTVGCFAERMQTLPCTINHITHLPTDSFQIWLCVSRGGSCTLITSTYKYGPLVALLNTTPLKLKGGKNANVLLWEHVNRLFPWTENKQL